MDFLTTNNLIKGILTATNLTPTNLILISVEVLEAQSLGRHACMVAG